ncbi:hypothetical protein QJS04_geneDACA020905 [Acorus gramineus]|uniref:Uncharacterized protein n=1 Tax=Acorus gramineus TaxID=55184 RepID=A0AAV9B2U9_ACOGR|nr:hypothetical protein QJS04_geneDACA020905 [Acorus gramineus]
MVPARNLLRRQYHSYGVCFDIDGDGEGGGGGFGNLRLSSDDDKTGSFMADDDSRSGGAGGGGGGGDDDDDGGWLRLGIGGDSTVQREGSSSTSLVELDLFSNRPSTTAEAAAGPSVAAQPMTTVGYLGPPPLMPRGFSWGNVPMGQWDPTAFAGSSSSSYEPQRRFVRPTAAAAQQQQPMWVVRPRVRAHVGIWFKLLASPNQ